MKIPGRAQCNCFLVKYIHNAKTGKFNRKQYNEIHQLLALSRHVAKVNKKDTVAQKALLNEILDRKTAKVKFRIQYRYPVLLVSAFCMRGF